MNPVFLFLYADGGESGCGTQLEFDHLKREGILPADATLGERIAWEHPRENDKRRKAWGIETAHDRFAAMVQADKDFPA